MRAGPPSILEPGRRRRSKVGLLLLLIALALIAAVAILLLVPQIKKSNPLASQGPHKSRRRHSRRKPSEAAKFRVGLPAAKNLVNPHLALPPRAGLLFNVKTGRVLWRRNPHRRLPIASLTKMMTALIVAERSDPHERVMITKTAKAFVGSGVGVLPLHKKVQLEGLLNGLLLPSGNDAAIALAQHVYGSVPNFVDMMNERAKSLGLDCTHFNTPHGFLDKGNYSCAADLAALARADLAQPRLRRIVRRHQAIVPFPIKHGKLFLYNNNPLVRRNYRGVTGLKTGYTSKAGICIVATAKRGKRQLGVVLIHSPDTYTQSVKLLDAGFRSGL